MTSKKRFWWNLDRVCRKLLRHFVSRVTNRLRLLDVLLHDDRYAVSIALFFK